MISQHSLRLTAAAGKTRQMEPVSAGGLNVAAGSASDY